MTTHRSSAPVTRRTALAGLGAGGFGLALAATARPAAAQEGAGDHGQSPAGGRLAGPEQTSTNSALSIWMRTEAAPFKEGASQRDLTTR